MAGNDLQLKLSRPDLLRDRGLINGVWSPAPDGAVFSVRDPASLKVVQTVSCMGAHEAQRAVDAAGAGARDRTGVSDHGRCGVTSAGVVLKVS